MLNSAKKQEEKFWQSLRLSDEEYRKRVEELNKLERTSEAAKANLKWLRDAEQIKD